MPAKAESPRQTTLHITTQKHCSRWADTCHPSDYSDMTQKLGEMLVLIPGTWEYPSLLEERIRGWAAPYRLTAELPFLNLLGCEEPHQPMPEASSLGQQKFLVVSEQGRRPAEATEGKTEPHHTPHTLL